MNYWEISIYFLKILQPARQTRARSNNVNHASSDVNDEKDWFRYLDRIARLSFLKHSLQKVACNGYVAIIRKRYVNHDVWKNSGWICFCFLCCLFCFWNLVNAWSASLEFLQGFFLFIDSVSYQSRQATADTHYKQYWWNRGGRKSAKIINKWSINGFNKLASSRNPQQKQHGNFCGHQRALNR